MNFLNYGFCPLAGVNRPLLIYVNIPSFVHIKDMYFLKWNSLKNTDLFDINTVFSSD